MMEEVMNTPRNQSGQILLIVVLSIVVALTVGLSIVSRTISNLQISKQSEESQRAFQAAEAGLERASQLLYSAETESIPNTTLGNNAAFSVTVEPEKGNEIILNGHDLVQRSIGLDVLMSNYSDNYSDPFTGRVRLHWGQTDQSCNDVNGNVPAALEVLLVYGDQSDPGFMREVYDPCGTVRTLNSTPAEAGGTIEGVEFRYSAVFPRLVDPQMTDAMFFKVIPIYNSTRIGMTREVGTQDLAAQGSMVTSVGSSGETVRKITYFQSFPQIPNELFPYTIVSQ